jgi:hypothetical protein
MKLATLTTALSLAAVSAVAQEVQPVQPNMLEPDAVERQLSEQVKSCRDFNCYYQVCMGLVSHVQERMLQVLQRPDIPPATLQSYQSELQNRAKQEETRRDCKDEAQIDVWCHGREDCIVEGQMGRDWAKKEGRPMTEQDWRIARCVRESIDRHEDAEVTRERCGR